MRALSIATIGAAAFLAPLALAAPASAHSQLVSSEPAGDGPQGDSVIESLPEQVSLTFSENLLQPLPSDQQQGGESTTQIRVYDETCADAQLLIADPGRADTRDCVDYAAGETVVDGPTASVEVDNVGAPAGMYTVVWQVVYQDGHPDSQMFTFTAENAVAAEETPTTDPTTEPSADPTAEPSDSATPQDPSEEPSATAAPGEADNNAAADAEETEPPAIIDDNGALSTPVVVAIVGGGLVLVLLAFIIVMISRARRS